MCGVESRGKDDKDFSWVSYIEVYQRPGQSHSVSHSVEKFRAYLPSPPMAQRATSTPTKGLEIHSAGLRVRLDGFSVLLKTAAVQYKFI